MIEAFNIRVYGLWLNAQNQVLLVHEKMPTLEFTKFPGGGVEFGEGIEDALIREFLEETGVRIRIIKHAYTTGNFVKSAFNPKHQLISVYYWVEPIDADAKISEEELTIQNNGKTEILRFFWQTLNHQLPDILTFPVDKWVANKYLL